MIPYSRNVLTLALAGGLLACGQPAPDQEQGDHNGHANVAGSAAPDRPGMAMHEAMASAVGADVADTWLLKMIEHHKGAIAMADAAVARAGDPRVVDLARRMAAQQRQEIDEMQRLVRKDAAADPASARPYAASEKQMHDAMMAAGGSDPAQTFLKQMIPHHRGAVAMSKVVVAQGRDERVAAIARRIIVDQGKEIAEMEAILGGRGAK